MAMEARCYHGGEGRTRLRVLRFTAEDARAYLVSAAALAVVIAGRSLLM
jgi:energy-coupling factor transport system permease protein